MLGQNVSGKPLLLIDGTRCPRLVQALHSKYLFGTTKLGQMKPLPAKTHPWSDLADCLQYVCLCASGPYAGALTRHMGRRGKVINTLLGAHWEVWAGWCGGTPPGAGREKPRPYGGRPGSRLLLEPGEKPLGTTTAAVPAKGPPQVV